MRRPWGSPNPRGWPAFFLPVRVLSRLFRRLFLKKLIEAHDANHLIFFGKSRKPCRSKCLRRLPSAAEGRRKGVYAKEAFAGPEPILRYLSRYTHRVAISNRRLVAADGWRRLPLEGLSTRWTRSLEDDDAPPP
jgi:Putative transposase